jgi:hypothetical protein
MGILKKIIILSLILLVSCGENSKKDNAKAQKNLGIEGFWKRTGMVQYVNGVAVDTMFYADGDLDPPGKDFIQMKAFLDGNIFWIMNNQNPDSPWKGSMGGYGKYEKETDSITEFMSHATGDMAAYMKSMKDEQNSSTVPFKFGYTLTDKNYLQKQGANEEGISSAEFYEKMPSLGKSKLDGIWKRAYEITYVNGIAVDTTSVPSDAILDVKIIKDGYFLFQVDRTKLAEDDPSKPEFGGTGGFGEVEYVNGDMLEYTQFASGTWLLDTLPRSIVSYADISFYDDDTFIQINKDTLGRMNAGRGVIYRRIK